MRASGYSLHLYCDNEACPDRYPDGTYRTSPQGEFMHELGSVCRRRARKAGWALGLNEDLCPRCSGKKPKSKTAPPVGA